MTAKLDRINRRPGAHFADGLPKQVRVYRGVRWRTDEDTATEAAEAA
jgi:hypothetical protein